MPVIEGKKFACATCIKGHRSSACQHTDRPVFEIKKKGRPPSQCLKCRQMRKAAGVHLRCNCKEIDSQPPSPNNELVDAEAQSKTPNLKALKAIQKATIQRAYMCQCLTGGSCICGPSRSGCKTMPATISTPVNPHESENAVQDYSHTIEIPVASTSALPYSAQDQRQAFSHRPEKPSPLSACSSALVWPLLQDAERGCSSAPQASSQFSNGEAPKPVSSCCSSKKPKLEAYAPYQVPLMPNRIASCCGSSSLATPPLTISISSEESRSDPNIPDFEEDPFGTPLFTPPEKADSDQMGFYGSGGDEDTPFDKHVVNDPLYAEYANVNRSMGLMWPESANSASTSMNANVELPQKEPLGMLFDDWVFGSVYVPEEFLSQYSPDQTHPETKSGCTGCGEGCMCGDSCECAHALAIGKYLLREQAKTARAPDPVDLAFIHSVLGPPSVAETVHTWQQENMGELSNANAAAGPPFSDIGLPPPPPSFVYSAPANSTISSHSVLEDLHLHLV